MKLSADALDIFLQKMPMGIAIINHDGTLHQCNDIWATYVETATGIPAQAIQPDTPLTAIIPPEIVDLQPYFDAAYRGQSTSPEILPLTTKKTTCYWNVFFSSVREQEQEPHVLMMVIDVTPRKQAEAAAQTAEQALLTLMNSLPGMAYRGPLEAKREMELVNKGAQELTGYLPEQFVKPAAMPYGSLIHEDDKQEVWTELVTAVQAKRPFELLYRIHTADGQIKWVLEQGSGLFDPDGKLTAIEGFISDITERMLAQQILERRVIDRTQKLAALYEMMTVAAEQGDLKTSLQRALSWVLTAVHGQAGCIHLLDHTHEWLHLAVHAELPPVLVNDLSLVSAQSAIWDQVLTTAEPLVFSDMPHNEQVEFWADSSNLHAFAGLHIAARGHLVGALSIWRSTARAFSESDVALMAAAAEQIGTTIENARLRRDNERLLLLDERNRLARELHDAVTQSLYSLTLFAEANQRFAKIGDLDNVQQYSSRIGETAEQSLKEMRLLLHNLRPSILQNAGLVEALQQRLDSVEKRAGIQIRLVYGDDIDLPPGVEETMFHIAEEALNNSLKHARATAVTITIQQSDTQVTLTIRDNGCGFDQSALPDKGGIGLASMSERAQMLGGTITIDSHQGETAVTLQIDLDSIKETTASQNLLDLLQD